MNNREVCESIRKNKSNTSISDTCVEHGYGQTCGGYLKRRDKSLPSEKEHFLNYYSNKRNAEKFPTYYRLRCPQLLLYIAEIAGVSQKSLEAAYGVLIDYEEKNNLRNTEKGGNYIWREKEFSEFKEVLKINDIVTIIRNAKTWDEVQEKASQL